uniref:BTB domain-containing protein n=1 Tax=Aureoumbra lagunensis TaxID=44058 RepID=A0A7S3K0J6_9STRA|mmetsp:Transcript_12193/g.16477  ORF Transcript_12193/g.16477 Transcript_12193/m.16477 type:complete len:605 (-) Transcript_12193:195-2009(-)
MGIRFQQILASRTNSLVLMMGTLWILNYRSWLRAAVIVLVGRVEHRGKKDIQPTEDEIPIAQVVSSETAIGTRTNDKKSSASTRKNICQDEENEQVENFSSDVNDDNEEYTKSRSRVLCLGAEGCDRLLASLRAQRVKNADVEIVLAGTGQKFYAHGCVLEAMSPELAQATRRARQSTIDRKKVVVEMSLGSDGELSPEALDLVLEWGYGALITLTETNVEPLLELASKLKITRLVDECCAFVAQRTSPRTACRVLAIADMHSCKLLRRDVLLCVLRHFRESAGLEKDFSDDKGTLNSTTTLVSDATKITTTNDIHDPGTTETQSTCGDTTPKGLLSSSSSSLKRWCTPSKKKLNPDEMSQEELAEARRGFLNLPRHLLDEILSDDRLFADGGESIVFRAAISWLEAEESRWLNTIERDAVLAQVRYYLIDAEFLYRVVEPHPLMQSAACQELVHAAYRYQALGKPLPSLSLLSSETCNDSVSLQAPPSTPRVDNPASTWEQRGPRLINKPDTPSAASIPAVAHLQQRHAVVVNDVVDGSPMLLSPRRSSAENPFLPVENRHNNKPEEDDGASQAAIGTHRVAALRRCERNDTNTHDPQTTAFV